MGKVRFYFLDDPFCLTLLLIWYNKEGRDISINFDLIDIKVIDIDRDGGKETEREEREKKSGVVGKKQKVLSIDINILRY